MSSSSPRFWLAAAVVLSAVGPLGIARAVAETPAASSDNKPSDAKASDAKAESKPTTVAANKRSKAEIEAMLTKCSEEADAKGLLVARGKGAARKAFRRQCMHRMGVDPR